MLQVQLTPTKRVDCNNYKGHKKADVLMTSAFDLLQAQLTVSQPNPNREVSYQSLLYWFVATYKNLLQI